VDVCWLDIRGKISTKMLSPHTPYAAYLIYTLADTARGLGTPLQETAITVGEEAVSKKLACLQPDDRGRRRNLLGPFRLWGVWGAGVGMDNAVGMNNFNEVEKNAKLPQKWEGEGDRDEDGWMEIEMGVFFNSNGEDGDVEMSFMEIRGGHWKKGLILHGIEIRPKH
jgi:Phloem protein 2